MNTPLRKLRCSRGGYETLAPAVDYKQSQLELEFNLPILFSIPINIMLSHSVTFDIIISITDKSALRKHQQSKMQLV